MTEGGLGRGRRRKARKIPKRPSRRCKRHCLHIFHFYHKVLQSWLPLERFVAFFCKVLMMAMYHRTSLRYDVNTSKNPDFPCESYGKFDFNDTDDSECLSEFRFCKSDLSVLSEALHLLNYLTCQQGTICDGIEGLCIALRRFVYPCRLSYLIPRFGRPVPELSMISSLVVDTIYQEHNNRITQWNDTLLNPGTQNVQCSVFRFSGHKHI